MRNRILQEDGPQAIPNIWRGIHVNASPQMDNGVFAAFHFNLDVAGRTICNSLQAITSVAASGCPDPLIAAILPQALRTVAQGRAIHFGEPVRRRVLPRKHSSRLSGLLSRQSR